MSAELGFLQGIKKLVKNTKRYVNVKNANANYNVATSAWATVLNTSGVGTLTRMSLSEVNKAVSNENFSIEVTIDGGDSNVITGSVVGGNASVGFGFGTEGAKALEWIGKVEFETSLLIRIIQISGTTRDMVFACDYSIV